MTKLRITKIAYPDNYSFWNFERGVTCKFALLSNGIKSNLKLERDKYSRFQVFGILYHFLEEGFSKNEFKLSDYDSFLRVLSDFTQKYDKNFDFKDYKNLDEWSEVIKLYDYFLEKSLRKSMEGSRLLELHFEEKIVSKNFKISGSVDLIKEYPDSLEVWEYKSGSLYDMNEDLNISYVRQLHFYSILAEEKFNKKISKLILSSPKSGIVEVLYDSALIKLLNSQIEETEEIINTYRNHEIEEVNLKLAAPSEDNCKYCSIKHLCTSFLNKQLEICQASGLFSISGDAKLKDDGVKEFNTVLVTTSYGEVVVKNVPRAISERVRSEKTYAFLDLQMKSRNLLVFNNFSRVLVYDGC